MENPRCQLPLLRLTNKIRDVVVGAAVDGRVVSDPHAASRLGTRVNVAVDGKRRAVELGRSTRDASPVLSCAGVLLAEPAAASVDGEGDASLA